MSRPPVVSITFQVRRYFFHLPIKEWGFNRDASLKCYKGLLVSCPRTAFVLKLTSMWMNYEWLKVQYKKEAGNSMRLEMKPACSASQNTVSQDETWIHKKHGQVSVFLKWNTASDAQLRHIEVVYLNMELFSSYSGVLWSIVLLSLAAHSCQVALWAAGRLLMVTMACRELPVQFVGSSGDLTCSCNHYWHQQQCPFSGCKPVCVWKGFFPLIKVLVLCISSSYISFTAPGKTFLYYHL